MPFVFLRPGILGVSSPKTIILLYSFKSNPLRTMSPSNHSNSDSAIIIFDWDDTILPSSFVDRANAEKLAELPQQFHNLFREIEQCTEKCLAAAAKHGEVGLSLYY
eukprot:scaffold37850_cov226-Skeletonema_marinoi.AAC.1